MRNQRQFDIMKCSSRFVFGANRVKINCAPISAYASPFPHRNGVLVSLLAYSVHANDRFSNMHFVFENREYLQLNAIQKKIRRIFHHWILKWCDVLRHPNTRNRLFSMQITTNNLIKQLRMNYCNAIMIIARSTYFFLRSTWKCRILFPATQCSRNASSF